MSRLYFFLSVDLSNLGAASRIVQNCPFPPPAPPYPIFRALMSSWGQKKPLFPTPINHPIFPVPRTSNTKTHLLANYFPIRGSLHPHTIHPPPIPSPIVAYKRPIPLHFFPFKHQSRDFQVLKNHKIQ
jgi:hypothetical protein